jgi:predicted RNase H-like nuclease
VRVLGIDLAWGTVNETGVVALDPDGTIADAAWTTGVEATAAWMKRWATADTLAFIDAPLVVLNDRGQRPCERQVGQCYGRWKVSANSTNIASPRLAGIQLAAALIAGGWRYHDGCAGPPAVGRVFSECYPYTALVGAVEFGYDDERPLYKRKPPKMRVAEWRPTRAANCDDLIRRLENLRSADPPLDMSSHPAAATLLNAHSPLVDRDYKHREDLIDAALAAWTGALWVRHGLVRCQVLGDCGEPDRHGACATIIAPARPTQRALAAKMLAPPIASGEHTWSPMHSPA